MKDSTLKAIRTQEDKNAWKHPIFPDYLIDKLALVAEEAGEAVREANNHRWHNGPIENVKAELIDTIAVSIRALESIE